jgi:glycosyltransferase involved in cell wall biosynthesis
VTRHPRILFLSHSASRNGATIVLLQFLRWLKGRVDWEIETLLASGGALAADFRALGVSTVLRDAESYLAMMSRRRRTALQPRFESWRMNTLFAGRRFDLVYANTAATWRQALALRRRSAALLWHVHELSYALKLIVPIDRASTMFGTESRCIAVSNLVQTMLEREYGVGGDRIDVVHDFAAATELASPDRAARREKLLQRFHWPADTFVVGGCGAAGWRKGTDLFVQIARRLCVDRNQDRVRFLWVGGDANDPGAIEFDHDVRACGLEGRCMRVPSTAAVMDYYAAMDIFALTSREDPFPLVMLEAGACGVPVVCFDQTGGGPEFVGHDAGLVAPYLDLSTFVDNLENLLRDGELRKRLGDAASKRALEFTVEKQAPKLLRALERSLRN